MAWGYPCDLMVPLCCSGLAVGEGSHSQETDIMIDRPPSISLRVTSCSQLPYDFVAQAVSVPEVGISVSRAQCGIWGGGSLGGDLFT